MTQIWLQKKSLQKKSENKSLYSINRFLIAAQLSSKCKSISDMKIMASTKILHDIFYHKAKKSYACVSF